MSFVHASSSSTSAESWQDRQTRIRALVSDTIDRSDIVAVIGHDTRLKKSGKEYKGLCPFHQEHTPSFFVNPEKGMYYCFGCGAKGTTIDYLIHHDGLSFVDALAHLGASQEEMDALFRAGGMSTRKGVDDSIRQAWNEERRARQSAQEEAARLETEKLASDPAWQQRTQDAGAILFLSAQIAYSALRSCDTGHPAVKYLESRGYTSDNMDVPNYFGVGYFPRHGETWPGEKMVHGYRREDPRSGPLWRRLRTHPDFSDTDAWPDDRLFLAMLDAGLIRISEKNHPNFDIFRDFLAKKERIIPDFFEIFSGRLVFPITDRGCVVAFSGRALNDGKLKYINSPKTALYDKSRVLYGRDALRDTRLSSTLKALPVLIVEGYFDVLSLHRAGWPMAVATCGTALSMDAMKRLAATYSDTGKTPDILLCLDGDSAGVAAAERIKKAFLEEYPEGLPFQVGILRMPDIADVTGDRADPGQEQAGMDPDDMVRTYARSHSSLSGFPDWLQGWIKGAGHVTPLFPSYGQNDGANPSPNVVHRRGVTKQQSAAPTFMERTWYWAMRLRADNEDESELLSWLRALPDAAWELMRRQSGWSEDDTKLWQSLRNLERSDNGDTQKITDQRVSLRKKSSVPDDNRWMENVRVKVEQWNRSLWRDLPDDNEEQGKKRKERREKRGEQDHSISGSANSEKKSSEILAGRREVEFVLSRLQKMLKQCTARHAAKCADETGSVWCLPEEDRKPLRLNKQKQIVDRHQEP